MGGGGGSIEGGEPEFQIAPMVDVLLVMLVFFMMITSAQVLKVDKAIQLPVAPDAEKKDNARAECVINVRWSPQTHKAVFVFDTKAFTQDQEAQLTPLLKAAKAVGEQKITSAQNPSFRAVIRGDKDLPAKYISQVMNSCGEAGISDISFSTVNKQ